MTGVLPKIDAELVVRLIRWAEVSKAMDDDPMFKDWGKWDQGNWAKIRPDSEGGVCGTAYCMAGQAVTQAGYRLDYDSKDPDLIDLDDPDDYLSVLNCVPQAPTGEFDDKGQPKWEDCGESVYIEATGRKVIGLTEYEADYFFAGENTIEELKGLANRFFAARGLATPYSTDEVDSAYELDTTHGKWAAQCHYENEYETHFPWESVAEPV